MTLKLIAEKLGRTDKCDRLHFVRQDGSACQTSMPRQGTLPHDLIHYIVETALPLRHGFLSLVAAGADAVFVMQIVHDPADQRITTEAVQVEAIVEALQTQLWAGAFDADAFLAGVGLASTARGRAPFDFAGIDAHASLYERTLDLLSRWNALPFHQRLELSFVAGAIEPAAP